MERKVFFIDNNNKKMQWLSTSFLRIAGVPLIDTVVLIGVIPTILFVLNMLNIAKLYLGGAGFINYIYFVCIYIFLRIIFAIFDFFKFRKLQGTMIVKENNDITFVKELMFSNNASNIILGSISYANSQSLLVKLASIGLYATGVKNVQKDLTEGDIKTIKEINRILDERDECYKYTDYKNCKLLKETKNYFKYIGEKNGVLTKFKIYKVYSNIDLINREGN